MLLKLVGLISLLIISFLLFFGNFGNFGNFVPRECLYIEGGTSPEVARNAVQKSLARI